MALTNNGVKVSINDGLIPDAYTKPSVTEFTDHELKYENREMTIAKATIENADEETAFTDLVAQIESDVDTLLAADIDTVGLTVTAWVDFTGLVTNVKKGAALYKNTAVSYTCMVTIYVKTA